MVRDYRAYFALVISFVGVVPLSAQWEKEAAYSDSNISVEVVSSWDMTIDPVLNNYGEPTLYYTIIQNVTNNKPTTGNGQTKVKIWQNVNGSGGYWRQFATQYISEPQKIITGSQGLPDGDYFAIMELQAGGGTRDHASNTYVVSEPLTWTVSNGEVLNWTPPDLPCYGLFYTYTNTRDVQMNVTINGSYSMNGHSLFPGEQLVLYQLEVDESASVNVWEAPTYGDDRYFQAFVTTVTATTYECSSPPGEEIADGGRDPDAPPNEEDFPDPLDPETPTELTPEQIAAAKETEKQVRIIREGMSGASVGVSKEDLDGLSVVIGEGTEPGGLGEAEYGQARSDAVDEMGAGWITAPNIGTGSGGGTPHGGELIGGGYIPTINLDSVLSTPTASAVAGWMRIACAWGLTLGWIMYVMKEVTRHLHAASQVTQVQSSFDFVNVVPGAGSVRSLAMAAVIVAAIAILPTTIYTAASTLVDGMSIASLSQSPYSAGGSSSGGSSITSTLATLDLFFPLGLSIAIGVQGVVLKFVGGAAFAGTVGIIKVSVG